MGRNDSQPPAPCPLPRIAKGSGKKAQLPARTAPSQGRADGDPMTRVWGRGYEPKSRSGYPSVATVLRRLPRRQVRRLTGTDMGRFLGKLMQHPHLSDAQEQELGRRICSGDDEAMHQLVRCSGRMALWWACRCKLVASTTRDFSRWRRPYPCRKRYAMVGDPGDLARAGMLSSQNQTLSDRRSLILPLMVKVTLPDLSTVCWAPSNPGRHRLLKFAGHRCVAFPFHRGLHRCTGEPGAINHFELGGGDHLNERWLDQIMCRDDGGRERTCERPQKTRCVKSASK
jgi:hypothetical protein